MTEEFSEEVNRKITITYGDITLLKMPEGAIVNPSNTGLILSGSIGDQISRRAGPLFQQELHILRSRMRNNQFDQGRVIETDPGQINVKYLLHASLVGRKPTDLELVTQVLISLFDLAERLELRTLAFPLIGVGSNKLSNEEFIELFWRVVNEELPRSESLDHVILCLPDEPLYDQVYDYITENEDLIDDDVVVEVVGAKLWQNAIV